MKQKAEEKLNTEMSFFEDINTIDKSQAKKITALVRERKKICNIRNEKSYKY